MSRVLDAPVSELTMQQLRVYHGHAALIAQSAHGHSWWDTYRKRRKWRRRRDDLAREIRTRPLNKD